MKLKNIISVLLLLFTCVAISCKKENNRIAAPTYELDSVVESYLDTLGNEYPSMRRTILTAADYLNNLAVTNPGYYHEIYTERNDSILIQNFSEHGCAGIADYNYITDGKFNKLYHETFQFCNHDVYYRFFQYITYNSDNKLSGILYRNMDVGGLPDRYSDDYWPNTDYFRSKGQESITFNYANNNIQSINYNSVNFIYNGYDSVVNEALLTYGYSHLYKNQKDLIGIDVNDIILSFYLMSIFSRNMRSDGITGNNNISLNSFYVPLIINKKATFNSNCENLIEEFNNPFYSHLSGNTSINISYEFDSNHDGRIKSMIFGGWTKFTFYYRD